MVVYNLRIFAYTIIGLAFLTYAIIFFSTQNLESIDFKVAASQISIAIGINIVIWLIFIKWLWKCKIFYSWLVPFPNISGEWKGTIKSNWKEKKLDPIPIEVTIHQTFFNTQVKIKTGESQSHSISAKFNIDKDRGLQQLIYTYINTPKPGVRDRSEIHYGSTRLDFDGHDIKTMEGEYWTSRQTTGEIYLERKE